MEVKVINKSNNPLPRHETDFSAGVDIRAYLPMEICIQPGEMVLIPTGLHFEFPDGNELQIRPRSGLAANYNVFAVFGTVDSDYRGEVKVNLFNAGRHVFWVKNGDRIAQAVIAPYHRIEFKEVKELNETERGVKGFGSTGKN